MFARRVAIGDPQAPFEKVLAILDRHRLLGSDRRLLPDVQLVSIGDHFDWGRPSQRAFAAASALTLIRWLTSHPKDQVILIAGNHDLARVGELAAFDNVRFAEAQREADPIYNRASGRTDDDAERTFLERFPEAPSAELVARDFSTFEEQQRHVIQELLDQGRLKIAHAAAPDLLLCHAGVTSDDLTAAGLPLDRHSDAENVAEALNRALQSNGFRDHAGKLIVPGLHRPGDSSFGEGRGILYHRPAHPGYGGSAPFRRPWARRFDPRRLPLGLTQAIGHIRDSKCRQLLHEWADDLPPRDGPLRHLRTNGATVRYTQGVPREASSPEEATLIFLDGGMLHADVHDYELLDLDTRAPLIDRRNRLCRRRFHNCRRS